MKEQIFCDQKCRWLDLSGKAQDKLSNGKSLKHKCIRNGIEILKHGNYHPLIIAGVNCYLRKDSDTGKRK